MREEEGEGKEKGDREGCFPRINRLWGVSFSNLLFFIFM